MSALSPFPPARAARIASALLSRHSAAEIGEAITVLIDVLDFLEPPTEDAPDFRPVSDGAPGDPGDSELDGSDQGDQAWIEWHTMRGPQKHGPAPSPGHEDAEEDDEAEEDDPSGQCDEDGINTRGQALQSRSGFDAPGCEISDPGGCQHDGDEIEQMTNDVPMLPVYLIDHNLFTDKRTCIGRSNLTTAFRGHERSADTGAMHHGRGDVREPGVPV